MVTVYDQLHNSATHRVGLDPACPKCIEKFVTGTDASVKARQRAEIAIAMASVAAALKAGYTVVGVENGEEDYVKPVNQTVAAVLDIMFKTDEDRLILRKGDSNRVSFIYFVYGNDGWNVISDYTDGLEHLMEGGVEELQERFGG